MKHVYYLFILLFLAAGSNATAATYNANDLAKLKTFLSQTNPYADDKRNIDILWAEAPEVLENDGSNWVENLGKQFVWTDGRLTNIRATQEDLNAGISSKLYGVADFSGCTELVELRFQNNRLTEINVSGCTKLKLIFLCINRIQGLNLENCYDLEEISSSGNRLTSLSIPDRTKLRRLYVPSNPFTFLNLQGCTSLSYLLFTSGGVSSATSLNISGCQKLDSYSFIPGITTLKSLDVSNCNIRSLDVSKNVNLENLICSGNQLYTLNLSGNTKLKNINAGNQTVPVDVALQEGGTLTLSTLPGAEITPSEGGTSGNGVVTWTGISKAGSYGYEFAFPQPAGITGTGLGGTVTVGKPTGGTVIGQPDNSVAPPTGECKETAVAIQKVEEETAVIYAGNGQLFVRLQSPAVVRVYSLTGQLVKQTEATTDATLPLPKGLYLVQTGNTHTQKVLVK